MFNLTQMRRVSYGNSTHLNISIEVQPDNKAVIRVALDRRDKDYFACDAGCLDPPVKLSTETKTFPVKLTDPVTAVLYITSDHLHMQELKHAIHVKDLSLGESRRILDAAGKSCVQMSFRLVEINCEYTVAQGTAKISNIRNATTIFCMSQRSLNWPLVSYGLILLADQSQ